MSEHRRGRRAGGERWGHRKRRADAEPSQEAELDVVERLSRENERLRIENEAFRSLFQPLRSDGSVFNMQRHDRFIDSIYILDSIEHHDLLRTSSFRVF